MAAIVSPQSTAVAIDKDKNSQSAVKWAVDNLTTNNPAVTLIHVRVRTRVPGPNEPPLPPNRDPSEYEIKQLFLPYRGFCARKKVQVKEIVLDDVDVVEAIVAYIKSNFITSIVVGASSRNLLSSWRLRNQDVPTALSKSVPEYCSVIAVSKGKTVTLRSASRSAPINATPAPINEAPPPRQQAQPQLPSDYSSSEDAIKTAYNVRGNERIGFQDKNPWERNKEYMRPSPREKVPLSPRIANNNNFFMENLDQSMFTPRQSASRDSILDEGDFSGSFGFRSANSNSLEFSNTFESPINSFSSQSSTSIEAEMKRLKLELKQTMDMYNSACKEALSAKQKAIEIQQWKKDEDQMCEEARLSEEAAIMVARMEKAKAMAAMEAAEASQRLAELEAKRTKDVVTANNNMFEIDSEKRRVMNALARSDIRYRRYSIEEIEIATNYFSDSLKIGEGGYGPVYRASLDHTPVAIKVLRADAAQGMKQFQQEVEVLSCIRHPNMVLLLGASPELGCLVYEYMDYGSLDDRLFRKDNTPSIPWRIRFKIAAEIATGLLFLHQTKPEPLVHRDLKPGNILLDRNYVCKISDVGLARLVPPSVADNATQYHMTSAAGTFCYIDPEYQQTGMLGTKSDVYSLGIMLLQIITAKPPMGLAHHVERSIEKGTFAQMLDPTVPDWPMEDTLSYAKLALKCAELRKKDRPDLGSVLLPELNRLKNLGSTEASSNFDTYSNGLSSSYNLNSSPRLPNLNQEAKMRTYPNYQRNPLRSNGEMDGFNSSPAANVTRFRPRQLPELEQSQE